MATSTLFQSSLLGSQSGSPRSYHYMYHPVSGQLKADWRASFANVSRCTVYRPFLSKKPSILRQHNEVWLPRRTKKTKPKPLSAKKKDAKDTLTSPPEPRVSKMLRCHVCTTNVKEQEYRKHLFFGAMRCELCSIICQDCRVFQWLTEEAKLKPSKCQHKLRFCEDPYDYLLPRLCGSDDHDLEGSSTLPHNLRVLQSYVNKLESPYLRQPWKDALKKCKFHLLKAYRFKASENSSPSPSESISQENSHPISEGKDQLHMTPKASEDVSSQEGSLLTSTIMEDAQDKETINIRKNEETVNTRTDKETISIRTAKETVNTETEGMDNITEETLESVPKCATECPIPLRQVSRENGNDDESLLLTQSYDLEQLEQEVEYVGLDILSNKTYDEVCSEENPNHVSEPKKRRKSPHKKAKRLFTSRRRTHHPVEQEKEEEDESLVLEEVETPDTGYYLMVQQTVEECPMCYQSFDPTMCTVNIRTFLFTVHCPKCSLIIYMVPDLPDGLQIVTEDSSRGMVTVHTKATKSTT